MWAAILLGLAACQEDDRQTDSGAALCAADAAPIHTVQGDGFQSPMLGSEVTVRGVVTHVTGTGFYLESLQPDTSDETSEGLFVQSGTVPEEVRPRTLLAALGPVGELGEGRDTVTAITTLIDMAVCQQDAALPSTDRRLPMSDLQREASEAMRLRFEQPLVVSGVYGQRRGELIISAERMLPAPTEVDRPGDHARERDWLNSQGSLAVRLAGAPAQAIPAGSGLGRMTGVLGHDGRQLELLLDAGLNPAVPPVPEIEPPAAGDLRILYMNLHNYFNGDGAGGGFLTNRGPKNAGEFAEKRRQLAAAVRRVAPHIVAVAELENDGDGPRSATADFVRDLNQATGHDWAPAAWSGPLIGSDLVRVGLFHRPDQVQALEAAEVLESAPFQGRSRVPLAQVFTPRDRLAPFLLVVTHLKSKSYCPEGGIDADRGDGQGCWNRARVEAVESMTGWAVALAGERANDRVLLLGDFNAYRLEDPIQSVLQAGFTDLTAPAGLGHEYSYIYHGASGTMDHAFASSALRTSVWRAQILHINAAYPPGMPLQHDWLGFSDHDPILVDLRFSH